MPINDEVPVLVAGLKPVLVCAEGQDTVITAEHIYATDADSDDSSLAFLIARQPYHGVVLRRGDVVDRFIQADVTAGIVTYRHTGRTCLERRPHAPLSISTLVGGIKCSMGDFWLVLPLRQICRVLILRVLLQGWRLDSLLATTL